MVSPMADKYRIRVRVYHGRLGLMVSAVAAERLSRAA